MQTETKTPTKAEIEEIAQTSEEMKLLTLNTLQQICDYLEYHTDYTIHIKIVVPGQIVENAHYRIFFSRNNDNWKYVDIPKGQHSVRSIYESFIGKSRHDYIVGKPPALRSHNELFNMDALSFIDNVTYSTEWLMSFDEGEIYGSGISISAITH